jgi:methionyl-tRNA synthetase
MPPAAVATARRSFSAPTAASSGKKFFVTTPIFYVNGEPHIGHLYSMVLGDSIARWNRACGEDVYFMGGTDEHGGKVAEAAAKAGAPSVKAFCDAISSSFAKVWPDFNISLDHYARTTDEAHIAHVQQFWRLLESRGHIYKGAHEGWYCRSDEAFYPENQIVYTDGPAGREPRAPSGHAVEWVSEPNYKFRLSAFAAPLRAWLTENPDAVQPAARLNEVLAFLDSGLEDISVSRLRSKVDWGVAVPGDDEHTVYVWLDALNVYLSSARRASATLDTIAAAAAAGDASAALAASSVWPADVHVVGKDIIKFHAIYWPAFLIAAGLPPPRHVIAHSHWTNGGVKMSKSLGNVLSPATIAGDFCGDIDAARFALLRHGPHKDDASYDRAQLQSDCDAELADTLGNLAMRATSAALLQDGRRPDPLAGARRPAPGVTCAGAGGNAGQEDVPGPDDAWVQPLPPPLPMLLPAAADPLSASSVWFSDPAAALAAAGADAATLDLVRELNSLVALVAHEVAGANAEAALVHISAAARTANAIVAMWKPWELKNKPEERARLDFYLYCALETVRVCALCLQAFTPQLARTLLDGLGVEQAHRNPLLFGRFGYRPDAAPRAVSLGFGGRVPFEKLSARRAAVGAGDEAAEKAAKAADREAKREANRIRKEAQSAAAKAANAAKAAAAAAAAAADASGV